MTSKMTPSGSAVMMVAACNPLIPPDPIKIAAMAAKTIPQLNFTKNGGFKLPFDVCIPSTKVAESAEVTKNVMIRNREMTDRTPLNGI